MTIDWIIRHLKPSFEVERRPLPHNVQHKLLTGAEERRVFLRKLLTESVQSVISSVRMPPVVELAFLDVIT